MAENVLHRKKRVTHIGKLTNSNIKNDDEPLLSECVDYVHNIMKEMDCGIKSVGCPKPNRMRQKNRGLNVQKNSEIETDKISSSSDLPNYRASNLKKYTIPRKYPLMEKSTKILRQLKHNRKIPKQRAHLASLHCPLVTEIKECKTDTVSERKSKKNSKMNEKVSNKKTLNEKTYNSCVERKNSKSISKTVETNISSYSHPEQNLPQKTRDKTDENSNSYLSGTTTDSEYERFVQNNKMAFQKDTPKNEKKSKKTLKNNKKTKLQEKSRSVHDDSDFNEYSSYDSSDDYTYKRKKILTKKSKTLKNKKNEANVSPEYTQYKTKKKKLQRKKKKSKEESQKVEENVDIGNSLQCLSEQYDSNFQDYSSDNDEESIFKSCKDIMGTKDYGKTSINSKSSDAKEISEINVEATSNNLLCTQESNNFSQLFPKKDSLIMFESSENTSINIPDVSYDSNLVPISKHNEINSKDLISETPVIINNALHNIPHSQVEGKNIQCHLGMSKLPSSSSKFSESSFDNIPVITLSSESDTEDETLSVSEKKNSSEVIVKTQNMSLCTSNYENPDLEIIEIIPSKENIPFCRKGTNDSENLSAVDTRSLYIQNRITQSDFHEETKNEANYSPKTIVNNVLENTLSKEEMKKILAQCNTIQVKQEKVSTHSVTYATDICREINEKQIMPKISGILKNPDNDETSQILESANYNPIDSATSVNKDTCSLKCEKDYDDDIIIINSEESKFSENFQNAAKQEIVDDDIIIDSFVKAKSKDISKISPLCNSLQIENIYSTIPAKMLSDGTLQNYLVNCKDIPKLLNSSNSSAFLKSDVKLESPGSANNVPVTSIQENAIMEKELFSQSNFPDTKIPVENALHLLQIYKKEFKTYQEILRTEKNVQAGLKFVETHQAEKLTYLRSKIQNLLKDSSDIKTNNCTAVKEQHNNFMYEHDILNNSENSASNIPRYSFGGCQENFSKSDCLTIQDSNVNRNSQTVSQPNITESNTPTIKREPDDCAVLCLNKEITQVQNPHLSVKSESDFTEKPSDIEDSFQNSLCVKSEEKTLILLDKKCNVCGRDALAACQKCAKVFFCSVECGMKFWNNGHEKTCGL